MTAKFQKAFTVLALGTALLGARPAAAQLVYTSGHGDLGATYVPGSSTFGFAWGIDAGAVVDGSPLANHTDYAPDELVACTMAVATAPGSSPSWLGVPAGSSVYRLGSDAYPPNLGFNSSGAGRDTDWLDSTLHITLTGWSGPGNVGLSYGSTSSAPRYFSTFDPAATVNNNIWDFDMGAGHIHLVWYFTEPGYYEVTFNWAGTYIGGDAPVDVTGSGTFGIYAGVTPVPEPATWGLLAVVPLGLALLRRRRQRKGHAS